MAGPSSTISLNSIVEVGIVDDIVGEIVTCGRVLRPYVDIGRGLDRLRVWQLLSSARLWPLTYNILIMFGIIYKVL